MDTTNHKYIGLSSMKMKPRSFLIINVIVIFQPVVNVTYEPKLLLGHEQ